MTSAVVPTQDIQNENKPIDREKVCILFKIYLKFNKNRFFSAQEMSTSSAGIPITEWTPQSVERVLEKRVSDE